VSPKCPEAGRVKEKIVKKGKKKAKGDTTQNVKRRKTIRRKAKKKKIQRNSFIVEDAIEKLSGLFFFVKSKWSNLWARRCDCGGGGGDGLGGAGAALQRASRSL
jgi:hypothetical protein